MSALASPRQWSLRRRLFAGTTLLVLVTLLFSGVATVLTLRASLYDRLDTDVRMGLKFATSPDQFNPDAGSNAAGSNAAGSNDTGSNAASPGSGDAASSGTNGPQDAGRGQRLDTLEIVIAADGSVSSSSYVSRDGTTTSLTATQVEAVTDAITGSAAPTTVDLGGTLGDFRVVSESAHGSTVVSGMSTSGVTATLASLIAILVVVTIAALAIAGAGIAWLVTVSLRPLRRVADTAERVAQRPLAVGAVTLPERAELTEDPRTEVGRVGAALDTLLNHVEAALGARQESEDRLRTFIADASHELRTPLASIRGYAQLAHSEAAEMTQTQERSFDRIESEAERMGVLVEDLLLLARLDSGQKLRREPVDVTMLAIETVSDAHAAMPDHEWIVDVDEPVEVDGDDQRIRQVLINLLGNAGKYTPAGTRVTVSVTAAVTGAAGSATITVADDGPGIDPALVPRLFDRFSRGDTARNRDAGSTGLGLSIAAAIVQEHGGTIDVASDASGTKFTIVLPRSGAAPAVLVG
ncbi:sensor histidine kinase [Leucobacter sp. NPDC058333]|uniref:sensor histidine kinase n=1 Tax=Leucobacter sp. NPDC058333 TaxID=3346450 RepID=UPI003647093B